jgi:hypothetical protein
MNTASLALTSSFIQSTLPQWFIQAPPPLRDALRLDMTRAQAARDDLSTILRRIQDLPSFARPLLQQALDAAFGPGLDVDHDVFLHARFKHHWLTGRASPQGSGTCSLLAAALQNFEAPEAQEAERETTSAILVSSRIGRESESENAMPAQRDGDVHPLNVQPARFIELCRGLDLGGQYQRHLHHVLHPVARPDVPGSLDSEDIKARIIEHARLALRVECHIGRLKGMIDEAQYQALLKIDVNSPTDEFFTLHILGCKLRNALLFKPKGDARWIAYLPGESDNVVESFASLDQLTQALRTRLRDEAYRASGASCPAQRRPWHRLPSAVDQRRRGGREG